jgi:hypothetical protein
VSLASPNGAARVVLAVGEDGRLPGEARESKAALLAFLEAQEEFLAFVDGEPAERVVGDRAALLASLRAELGVAAPQ